LRSIILNTRIGITACFLLAGCANYSLRDAPTANAQLDYLPWRQTASTQNVASTKEYFRVERGMRLAFIQAPINDLGQNYSTAPLSISYWEVPDSSSLEVKDYAVMGWMLESAIPVEAKPQIDPLTAISNGTNPNYGDVLASMRLNFNHAGEARATGQAWDASEMRDALCTARAHDYPTLNAGPSAGTSQAPYLFFKIAKKGQSRGMRLGGWNGWFFENSISMSVFPIAVGNDYYAPAPQDGTPGTSITRLRMTVAADIPIEVNGQAGRFVSPCTTVADLEARQGFEVENIARLERFRPDIRSSNGSDIPADDPAGKAIVSNGRFEIAFYSAENPRPIFPATSAVLNAVEDEKCGMLLAPGDVVTVRPALNYKGSCPRPRKP
jgi:hypothetical protein